MIDQETLKKILHYDPKTGVFTRINSGKITGSLTSHKYLSIRIFNKNYYCHRLAWLYMTGNWPENQIDHIDLDRSNNKWNNLREADCSENSGNTLRYSNNKSGIKGISWAKERNQWVAFIRRKNIHKNLGYYDNIEDATKAYSEAADKYFNEFART